MVRRIAFFALALVLLPGVARADTSICTLTFSLRGWDPNFNDATGRGKIACDNGQHANVAIAAGSSSKHYKAGVNAMTAVKGTFSPVLDLAALLGSYTLPKSAEKTKAKPAGVAGAMTNKQATIVFPMSGASSNIPGLYDRLDVRPSGSLDHRVTP